MGSNDAPGLFFVGLPQQRLVAPLVCRAREKRKVIRVDKWSRNEWSDFESK